MRPLLCGLNPAPEVDDLLDQGGEGARFLLGAAVHCGKQRIAEVPGASPGSEPAGRHAARGSHELAGAFRVAGGVEVGKGFSQGRDIQQVLVVENGTFLLAANVGAAGTGSGGVFLDQRGELDQKCLQFLSCFSRLLRHAGTLLFSETHVNDYFLNLIDG